MIELKPTPRGFLRGEFRDRYGQECSIQESSLAEEPCLWLGVDIDLQGNEVHKRMHLTRDMAHELVLLLQYFIRNEGLGRDDPNEVFQVGKWVRGIGDANRDIYGRIVEVVQNDKIVVQDNNVAAGSGRYICEMQRAGLIWELTQPPEEGPSRYAVLAEAGDDL